MLYNTDDTRIIGQEEVIAPDALIADLPVDPASSRLIFDARRAISDAIHGRSRALVVVVGPCSIHDPAAALDYAGRLAGIAARYEPLQLAMRVYFEKPRTTIGWKGLINDPDLDESFDINRGLHLARGLLRDIARLGLPSATEYLDPITPQYIGDLVAWAAIGARTTESQVHRQLASGVSCPIGFKNSTDGSVQVAIDACRSAAHPHIFLSVTKKGHSAIFRTAGNGDCHVILRGGGGRTNYDEASVQQASAAMRAAGLPHRLMVDLSHANSAKDHQRQVAVADEIARQLESGSDAIMGVMIESHLVAGRQDIGPREALRYGQSITDACIDWDTTVRVLDRLAEAAARRGA